MIKDFQFAYPGWLVLAAIFVLVIGLGSSWLRARQKKKMKKVFSVDTFAQISTQVSRTKFWIKLIFRLAMIGCLGMALARPQWGFVEREFTIETANVVFVFDVSKSMLASDLQPTRLDRSKLFILDLLEKLQGERVGLVAFAGDAFLQCPLTLDYDAFVRSLRSLDTNSLSRGGSDIALALSEAVLLFPEEAEQKVLVLLTDGEDLAEQGIETAKKLSAKGVKVFTVGVGSEQGDIISIEQEDGTKDVLRDKSGQPVVSRLDRSTLEAIAQSTGAFYSHLASPGDSTEKIYEQGIKPQEATEEENKKRRIYNEWFTLPLGLAAIFLLIETVITTRRKQ